MGASGTRLMQRSIVPPGGQDEYFTLLQLCGALMLMGSGGGGQGFLPLDLLSLLTGPQATYLQGSAFAVVCPASL